MDKSQKGIGEDNVLEENLDILEVKEPVFESEKQTQSLIKIVHYCSSDVLNVELENKKNINHKRTRSQPFQGKKTHSSSFTKSLQCKFNSLHDTAVRGTQHMVDKASWVAQSVVKYSRKLLSPWELPEWLRDNLYIHNFHRPQLHTFKQCFKSIFSIHTETGNIWTHLIGLIIMIAAACYIFILPHTTKSGWPFYPISWQSVLAFSAYFFGACFCMTFSWLFHTLSCHSEKVHSVFAKLDYSGISFLICGSMMPIFYYGFYCLPKHRIVYIIVSLLLSITCITVSLIDRMSTPKFRPVRALIFLCFGFSSVIAIIHAFVIYKTEYVIKLISFYWLIIMGLFYVAGCLLYIFMIPERIFPGKINLIFQSHQIFHVCVVLGAIIHLHGICLMASQRHRLGYNCLENDTYSYRYPYY